MPGKGNGCRSPKRTVRSTDAERPPGAVRTGSGPGARRRGLARPGRRADRAGRFPLVRPQLPGIHCHPGVGERHRGPRTEPPHRVHRADLPGSRGVCGHRSVHLGAADVEARRHLVARLAGRRHCRRGLWVSRRPARAAPHRPLPGNRHPGLWHRRASGATNWEALSGGRMGLPVPQVTFGPAGLTAEQRLYYLAVGGAVLLTWVAFNLTRSHVGRAFVAIRDNDIAAEVVGVNLTRYKTLAFAVSAFYAGI